MRRSEYANRDMVLPAVGHGGAVLVGFQAAVLGGTGIVSALELGREVPGLLVSCVLGSAANALFAIASVLALLGSARCRVPAYLAAAAALAAPLPVLGLYVEPLLVGYWFWLSGMAALAVGAGVLSGRPRRRVCGHCGYDLRGHEAAAARCPECGRQITSTGT